MNLADRAHDLLEEQKGQWPLLRDGYVSLQRVEKRTLTFDGFQIELHFNPGRIASSAAKVDAVSISQRPCFLCPQNRPKQQRAIELHDDLVLLCNPFPIFPGHFTIPTLAHTPQRVRAIFPAMLDLARELVSRYTVFYNGPQSGASAPDHLHLQAGDKNFTPTDREYATLPKTTIIQTDRLRVFAVDGYLRRLVCFESSDRERLVQAFDRLHAILDVLAQTNEADEPMLNVFVSFDDVRWRIIVFPRARHRPSAYFAEGDARILLSPGAVDMAGAVIVPVERDFKRITEDDVVRMFDEVTLPSERFAQLSEELRARLV